MDLATVDHLLTTTRSVRKRLDLSRPVEPEVIERCIEIAFQAPTGSNLQGWHFMVVTDPEKRAGLAEVYRKGLGTYRDFQSGRRPQYDENDPRLLQMQRVGESSTFLGVHLQDVPVHIIPCIEGWTQESPNQYGRGTYNAFYYATIYGSIIQAGWSLQLALRARGLGSSWTTIHLVHEMEAADILGLPDNVEQAALVPVAYFTGTDFKPAERRPAQELTHWNTWGQGR
ncbi:MAG: nitroreductase family protein [Dehalococcoidia bacterium]|nr:nitroreductase family protein [Dehalococcoidia bacterium]